MKFKGYAMMKRTYIYIGDKNTLISLKNQHCQAVLRKDGKCIRGTNGNMLVHFNGKKTVVVARLLRKVRV